MGQASQLFEQMLLTLTTGGIKRYASEYQQRGYPDSHLVLSIADAPEFPFALAWMPLWDKQAFVSDGKHSLVLHAYDKVTSSVVQGRGAYLSLPWNNASYKTIYEGTVATIAALEVYTQLCSNGVFSGPNPS